MPVMRPASGTVTRSPSTLAQAALRNHADQPVLQTRSALIAAERRLDARDGIAAAVDDAAADFAAHSCSAREAAYQARPLTPHCDRDRGLKLMIHHALTLSLSLAFCSLAPW
jgi:hypothetical protein